MVYFSFSSARSFLYKAYAHLTNSCQGADVLHGSLTPYAVASEFIWNVHLFKVGLLIQLRVNTAKSMLAFQVSKCLTLNIYSSDVQMQKEAQSF